MFVICLSMFVFGYTLTSNSILVGVILDIWPSNYIYRPNCPIGRQLLMCTSVLNGGFVADWSVDIIDQDVTQCGM
jgi:hypothetical protein